MGKITQGDYRFTNKIEGSKKRIIELFSAEEAEKLRKYENALVLAAVADGTKAKNYDMILSLTRMLDGKSWLSLNQDDIENLVVTIMVKHGDSGKETNTTSDHKRFLKIWFRFVKLGSRSFKKVGDPDETRDIVSKNIDSKVGREQLISPEECKRLVDCCPNMRDKALIHVHYDAGTRIGEILSVQIKHIKHDRYGYTIAVDGKTGFRNIRLLESSPTLARWLEMHPHNDDPEAYLFPNMKHVWKGNKFSYAGSVRVLKTAAKEARFNRRIYWHLFRHSEATRTATYMSDSVTKLRHGWSKNSKMPARYSHITNKDVDEAFLKHHGIEIDDTAEIDVKPISCPICKIPNNHDTKICQNCGNPLSTEMAILLESEKEKKTSDLEKRVEIMEEFILKQAHESVKDPNGLKALKDVMKKDNSCFTAG